MKRVGRHLTDICDSSRRGKMVIRSKSNYWFYLLGLLMALVSSWLLADACLTSNERGEMCLGWATPYVHTIFRPVANYLGDYPKHLYNQEIPWFCGAVLLMSLVSFVRGQLQLGAFLLLAVLPILGEGYALAGERNLSIASHLSGALLLAIFWALSKRDLSAGDSVSKARLWELGVFGVLMGALLFMRFYALNRIPWNWDTELCLFRQISSSWDRIWQHESGFAPQSSIGLSWLLINKALGHSDEPVTYYLLHRFVGCSISVLKVTLLFLFLRTYFGRFPAFFGAALLAFGPPEDWWARVPSYHHWPGVMAILVIWATIHTINKRTWTSFVLLSLVTALTRFVYPSAMFMGFVPITFFISLLVFQWSEWRRDLWKISVLLLGVAFWMEWLSVSRSLYLGRWEALPPLLIPSHSEMSGGLLNKLHHIFITNGAELISAIFYHQVNSTHWTFALTAKPWRSVPSAVVVLVVIALARMIGQRKDKIAWLLTLSLGFCALPGITSQVADRRIGSIFSVLIVIAAREAGWICQALERSMGRYIISAVRVIAPVAVAVYLGALGGATFFFSTPGIPRQIALGKVFRENVKTGNLLVDLTGQLQCDMFYSIYRDLKGHNCDAGFVSAQFEGPFTAEALIENPRVDTSAWWYGIFEFAQCREWADKKWDTATFLITESPMANKWLDQLRQRFPQGVSETHDVSYMEYQKEPVIVFTTSL
jgi:hypothetical protein